MTIRLTLLALLSLALVACNGTSGENGDDPFGDNPTPPVVPVIGLTLTVLDANCQSVAQNSFKADQTVCIEAQLTEDDIAVGNEIINFSSGIGVLDVASKLTDANGVAQVFLSSDGGVVGAAIINASFDTVQAQASLEFTAADPVEPPGSVSVSLEMLNQAGEPTLRFAADQQVRLKATLVDPDGMPLADEILAFSVTRGELTVSDALTNSDGEAEVLLNGQLDNVGAGIASVSLLQSNSEALVDTVNFEIQSVDAVEEDVVRIGYFDGADFIEGVLGVNGVDSATDVVIGAGATLGLLVGLADADDAPIVGSTPITFTSSCVQENRASIDTNVATVNGRASSTYADISCATGSGNDDIISATVLVNNTPLSVSRNVELLPEDLGSIEFVSAQPDSIVLQGTGGQGSESISTITFQVNGSLGNPLSQQAVEFELSTQVGGLSLSPSEGLTNSDGQVSTRVTAGNVPTSVRVIAKTQTTDGDVITTQSDQLSVNTGLPDQNSFSLSTDNLNPEAASINGQQVNVTAYLADAFNNPVPDGTAIAFTTEGGQIQPSCVTQNGSCNVIWTSADPRVDDHRITILATAIGHETLFDSNGNNVYDAADGGPLDLGEDAGFTVPASNSTGFSDISEAWRDDNENNRFDVSEVFLDFNNSGTFTGANSRFDGPQCEADNCGGNGLHVRRALVMVMSSSAALISFNDSDGELANNQQGAPATPLFSIPRGESAALSLVVTDTALQTMPSATNISLSTNNGDLAGQTAVAVRETNQEGGDTLEFVLTNNLLADQDPIDSTVTATVVSPSGVESTLSIIISLE